MKTSSRLLTSIIITLCFIPALTAQQSIRFKHLTSENGLSQNSVTCIFQDSRGFMWFGTQDGLNRFDGYNFKVFKNDPSDPKSLAGNFIASIHQEKSGNLFFETIEGIVQKYNPSSESFTVIPGDSINLTALEGNSVLPYIQDGRGIRWKVSGRGGKGRNDPGRRLGQRSA